MLYLPKETRITTTNLSPYLDLQRSTLVTIDGRQGYLKKAEKADAEIRVTVMTGGALVTFVQKL